MAQKLRANYLPKQFNTRSPRKDEIKSCNRRMRSQRHTPNTSFVSMGIKLANSSGPQRSLNSHELQPQAIVGWGPDLICAAAQPSFLAQRLEHPVLLYLLFRGSLLAPRLGPCQFSS